MINSIVDVVARRHASDLNPGSVTFVQRSRELEHVSLQSMHAHRNSAIVIENGPMSGFTAGCLLTCIPKH